MNNLREQGPPIRVSTGWGFANDFPPLQHQILANITDGVELSLTATDRFSFYLEHNINSPSTSIHLSSPIPEDHISALPDIIETYDSIEGFVLHPRYDVEAVEESLSGLDIREQVMMENLDSETDTEDSEKLLEKCLDLLDEPRLTIDLQHLSEQYTLEESKEFIEKYKDEVQQFHVSGRTEDSLHELLIHEPNNQDEIEAMLEYIATDEELSSVPLIIEGKYSSVGEVKEEYEYLKQLY